jgi:acylphosphatase
MEYCIIYVSSGTNLLTTEKELVRVLPQFQEKNRALGITGVLLYFNGNILQVLEGDQEEVDNLYKVISEDPRHAQVIQLYRSPIEQRSFTDWSMGYKTLSEADLDHLGNLITFDRSCSIVKQDNNNLVRHLVQIFYQNNYRN